MKTTRERSLNEMSSNEFVQRLDDRIQQAVEMIEQTELWRTLMDPNTAPQTMQSIMKEMYLEIAGYQSDLIEAMMSIVGQMPRSIPAKKIRSMLIHLAEEFDHGEMAIRDYVALGGDEVYARTRRRSPAAFAHAGVWWMLARQREPLAYLGPLYFFEGLTPMLAERVLRVFAERGLMKDAAKFVEFHAEADIRHQNLLRKLVMDMVDLFPNAAEEMEYALDCLMAVYPVPVWDEVFRRAVGHN